jgi:magnesium-protoporphyrin O-methyltransferase
MPDAQAPLTVGYTRTRAWLHDYFDRQAADKWEALTSTAPVSGVRATVRAGRDRMRQVLLGWLPGNLYGARVLDAGCGTGAAAVELARRGAEVVAIDLSPTLVEVGRARAAESALRGRIDWRSGDMLDPSLGEFDHVIAMDSLIHYEGPDALSALEALIPRVRSSIVWTFAPRTPLLSVMHAVGRLIPNGDRAPRIVPVAETMLRSAVGSRPALATARVARTQVVKSGFYTSQAMELTLTPRRMS